MRSCSTNQRRTSFSLFVFALPEPREAAQLTIGARRACNRLAHALQEAVDALSAVAR